MFCNLERLEIMKVLLTSDTFFPLADEFSNFTLKLAKLLLSGGHTVSVICPSEKRRNSLQIHNNIKIYRITNFDFRKLVLPRSATCQAIKEINPDIIHIHRSFYLAKYASDYAHRFVIPTVNTEEIRHLAFYKNLEFKAENL
jgi:hypothetical protein